MLRLNYLDYGKHAEDFLFFFRFHSLNLQNSFFLSFFTCVPFEVPYNYYLFANDCSLYFSILYFLLNGFLSFGDHHYTHQLSKISMSFPLHYDTFHELFSLYYLVYFELKIHYLLMIAAFLLLIFGWLYFFSLGEEVFHYLRKLSQDKLGYPLIVFTSIFQWSWKVSSQ